MSLKHFLNDSVISWATDNYLASLVQFFHQCIVPGHTNRIIDAFSASRIYPGDLFAGGVWHDPKNRMKLT
jgi:hypothetical protein